MLDGGFTGKVDDKGRVKIPSEFRRRILDRYGDNAFYVTSADGKCARIYPARVWEDVLERINQVPPSRQPVAKFRRATSYYGQSVTMDPQGRVLIHPRLREATGIDDEVVILGQNNHLEVWNHQKFKDDLLNNPLTDEDSDELAGLGL